MIHECLRLRLGKINAGSANHPARRETFLAPGYPRKLKLGAVGFDRRFASLAVAAVRRVAKQRIAHRQGGDQRIGIRAPRWSIRRRRCRPCNRIAQKGKKAPAPRRRTKSPNDTSSVFLKASPRSRRASEETPQGSLPRIGEDGRQPWQVYARPFNTSDKRPRVAIVITDLGMARVSSDAAISRLPPNVDLAFNVQSPVVGAWLARARQAGHETVLMLPMEPFDYPRSDPGPNSLLSNLPNSDNLQRLQWALMQASGYVGITTLSGSRLTTDPSKITPILDVIHKRGLMVFDARVAPHSAITDLAHARRIYRSQSIPNGSTAICRRRGDRRSAEPSRTDRASERPERSAPRRLCRSSSNGWRNGPGNCRATASRWRL